MVAIPFFKLFTLTVKTLSKPVATRIKAGAQRNQAVRGVLIAMARAVNDVSLRVSIKMAGHTMTKIKPLEEERALKAGGDLLGEGIVWAIGGFIVVWEYGASARDKERKDAAAKAEKAREKQDLADALEAIRRRLEALEIAKTEQETQLNRNWLQNELPQAVAVKETSVDDAKPQDPPPKGWWRFLGIAGGGARQVGAGGGAGTDDTTEHDESTFSQESVDGRLESPNVGSSSSLVGGNGGESDDWASKSKGSGGFR